MVGLRQGVNIGQRTMAKIGTIRGLEQCVKALICCHHAFKVSGYFDYYQVPPFSWHPLVFPYIQMLLTGMSV